MKKFDLKRALTDLARSWPQGGDLVFYIEDDHIWLHKIRLPANQRGGGTDKLATFLSYTDKAGLPVCLTADPLADDDMPTGAEPTTFDLVRWYQRFGFVALGPSEDGFLMQRDPARLTKDEILRSYQVNKQTNDLKEDDFRRRWPRRPYRCLGM